jgi:hypothetical protein
MSDEESYEYEYDDDDMDEGGFQYTDDEEEANDGEVALGMLKKSNGDICVEHHWGCMI